MSEENFVLLFGFQEFLTALLRAEKIFFSFSKFFYGLFPGKIGVADVVFHHESVTLFALAGRRAFLTEPLVKTDKFIDNISKQPE